jgi:type III restriction enzyme
VDNVGKRGQAGQDLQNVVSVAMLSEGWDAKNVTHIMGCAPSPASCCASR